MANVIRDIAYDPAHGVRGLGDLYLPPTAADQPPVLMIHGGGWNALTKESMSPIAETFAANGQAVFNINYRVLDQGPWPACRDDCVAAARFMLAGGLASHGLPKADRLLICGASAGGHLAMMTGIALPAQQVEAIVSISGPSRMDYPDGSSSPHLDSLAFREKFFGMKVLPADAVERVSPVFQVKPGAPLLYCIHSNNDRLVPPSHSHGAIAAWRQVGTKAEGFFFDGPGESHGIWTDGDLNTRRPVSPVNDAIAAICAQLRDAKRIPA
jgi:acetyl esterase/lipase